MQRPPLLAIALWLTGAMWFVGLLAYRLDQPPEVVGGWVSSPPPWSGG